MSKIDQLIKLRKDEAIEKEISHKVRTVVKYMGRKIVSQGEHSLEEWELMNQEIFEADESSRQIGWLFQAYPFGKEFEIQYLTDQEVLNTTWFGAIVYAENDGVATAFVPGEWENFLNQMYEIALPREEEYTTLTRETTKALFDKKLENALNYLQKTWGISF